MNFIKEQFAKEREAGKRVLPKYWKFLAIFLGLGGLYGLFSSEWPAAIVTIIFALYFYSLSKRFGKEELKS